MNDSTRLRTSSVARPRFRFSTSQSKRLEYTNLATESRTTIACCWVKFDVIFSPLVISCFLTVHFANSVAFTPSILQARSRDGSVGGRTESVLEDVIFTLP